MTDMERLIGLARIVRVAFERLSLARNYREDLGGLCYEASRSLRRLAAAHGIETDMGMGKGHWFVLYGNMVVDVTSTQFGQPDKVAVLLRSEAEKIGPWWELQHRSSDPPPSAQFGGIEDQAEKEIVALVGDKEV